MKKLMIATVLVSALLTGCASSEYKQAQLNYYSAQAEMTKAAAAQRATPLLSLEMGEDGKLKTLTVGRQEGNQQAQMAMPQDPNAEMLRSVVNGVVSVGSIVAGGNAARGLAEAVGAAAGQGYKYIQSPTVVQPAAAVIPQANVTTTMTLSGQGVIGSGSFSAPATTTTSTDNHTVSNSNNPVTTNPGATP